MYIRTQYGSIHTPFDFSDEKKRQTLIHEICHCVKGYETPEVLDGKVVSGTGLSKALYSADETGKLVKESETNCGIEEAINEYDTTQIMQMLDGKEHEPTSYSGLTYLIAELMKNKKFVI